MFDPKYTITHRLNSNIKRIGEIVVKLNHRTLPRPVFYEMAQLARETSTYASTSIEGNPLPLTEVKIVLKNNPENARDSEKEVINYNNTLVWLNQLIENKDTIIDKALILRVHRGVIGGLLPISAVGKFRKLPVVVNDPRSRKIAYLPPDWSEVEGLVDELLHFVNTASREIDPLILAGILHKQMVIIHPFMDGNGRTTRLITKLLLARMGLDTFNLFSFENYYNQNVTKYFSIVGEYGDYNELKDKIDFTNWLEYFTDGIIDELLRVEKNLLVSVGNEGILNTNDRKILSYIDKNGRITEREYEKITTRSRPTRILDLRRLVQLGVIERRGGGRSTYYVKK